MNETIKERKFYEVQKFVATREWTDLRDDLQRDIQGLEDFILEDAHILQPLEYSRNVIRGKGILFVKSISDRIHNEHLQAVLKHTIIDDSTTRLLIPTEISEDIVSYSEKDWARRKRRILQYIVNFDKIYGQEEKKDNNESVEVGMNSLEEGISL